MSADEPRPRRPSLRLPQYDYGQPGGYFVTICTQNRVARFGAVADGQMHLGPAGLMAQQQWEALASRFSHITLDEFVVMPNHVHGIILINQQQPKIDLGHMVGAFKSLTTRHYIQGVREAGWDQFSGILWQDNFFEQVIRDDAALDRIREYIQTNPARWDLDPEHPSRHKSTNQIEKRL